MSNSFVSKRSKFPGGMVIFAHVPPPHHGQSKMVEDDLAILREEYEEGIFHVDARWSETSGEIGASSWKKAFFIFKYVREALLIRWNKGAEVLYYVPGPVKWSAVIRDFVVLLCLRPFFRKTVFHWHAIGQGEWAHGSERVMLRGPRWVVATMSFFSRWVLAKPELSLVVSSSSSSDARAVESGKIEVVLNGISDLAGENCDRPKRSGPMRKLLFFSRGTVDKGLLDALAAVEICAIKHSWLSGEHSLTIAGGVDPDIEGEVIELCARCEKLGVEIERRDFVVGDEKAELFKNHDLLLFPSRWESFGLVIVEAMAFDLPVVAAASDGALGILGLGYPFLFEPKNVVNFSDSIAKITSNSSVSVSEFHGREEFLSKFSISRHREDLLRAVSSPF